MSWGQVGRKEAQQGQLKVLHGEAEVARHEVHAHDLHLCEGQRIHPIHVGKVRPMRSPTAVGIAAGPACGGFFEIFASGNDAANMLPVICCQWLHCECWRGQGPVLRPHLRTLDKNKDLYEKLLRFEQSPPSTLTSLRPLQQIPLHPRDFDSKFPSSPSLPIGHFHLSASGSQELKHRFR